MCGQIMKIISNLFSKHTPNKRSYEQKDKHINAKQQRILIKIRLMTGQPKTLRQSI